MKCSKIVSCYSNVLSSLNSYELRYKLVDTIAKMCKCKDTDESKSSYKTFDDFIYDISYSLLYSKEYVCTYINRLKYHHPDVNKIIKKWWEL